MAKDKKKRIRKDRRIEILQAAVQLLGIHGFRGTTLAKVAAAVDLTEAGLLHYFPSKVHLLQGVLEYREQQDAEAMEGGLDLEDLQLSETLKTLNAIVKRNETNPVIIRLFTVLVSESIRLDHPSHDYFVKRYRSVRSQFVDMLKTMAESGEIRADIDFENIANLLIAVMDGLQIQWLLDPEKVSMPKAFDLFSKLLLPYLEE